MCIVLCTLALVVLFFPFTFWIHGELDVCHAKAVGFFYKKQLFEVEKVFGEGESAGDFSEEKPKPSSETCPAGPSERASDEQSTRSEETFRANADAAVGVSPEDSKEERSLTDKEFWTILLTPDFDALAWWAVKKLLLGFARLCHLKFINSYIEGIRADYARMGEIAALNGFLKSYPYIGDWDFRMDWTQDHELRGEGHARLHVNLCRLIGLILIILAYGGIVLWSFWRRRARVLKTNELPELGFVRKKIVKMMAEE